MSVAVAAASVAAVTWPGGTPAGAVTTAAHVPAGSGPATDAWAAEQWQAVKLKAVRQAQWATAIRAERAAAARRAARKAAAARAAAHRDALLAAQRAAAKPVTQPSAPATPAPAPARPSGSPQQIAMAMLGSFGWSSGQFGCLDSLWSHESGWNVTASNPDGAYGIPQALPGSKMASAGPDWQTDAATQIRWGLGYIKALYGSPCRAWAQEEATGWY